MLSRKTEEQERSATPVLYSAHVRCRLESGVVLIIPSLIGDVLLRQEKVEGGVAVFLYHGYVRRVKFYLYIINRPDEIDRYTYEGALISP